MKLLALETATEACSIAIYVDGEIRERHEIAPRRHAELALPWAQALLAEAGIPKSQLDAIAISRGPGAFTGVRLAIALAQGIAMALDRPLLAVSTLQVLALQATRRGVGPVLAAIDARMGEIYVGGFDAVQGMPVARSVERVLAPGDVELPGSDINWRGVGTGFAAGEAALQQRLQGRFVDIDAHALPHAADLALLAVEAHARGEALAPEAIEPAYLRDNVALTLAEQQALRAEKAAAKSLE